MAITAVAMVVATAAAIIVVATAVATAVAVIVVAMAVATAVAIIVVAMVVATAAAIIVVATAAAVIVVAMAVATMDLVALTLINPLEQKVGKTEVMEIQLKTLNMKMAEAGEKGECQMRAMLQTRKISNPFLQAQSLI